jgi:hypothetical protein
VNGIMEIRLIAIVRLYDSLHYAYDGRGLYIMVSWVYQRL